MSRFDYIRYDALSNDHQAQFKAKFQELEQLVEACFKYPGAARAKALVMTYLEIAYMWIGKAMRDNQLARNNGAELQEGRGNE